MNAVLKQCAVSGMAVAMLFLAGCTPSTPAPVNNDSAAATPAARPEPVPAKTAFWPMYTAAHSWAPDVVILGISAKEIPGFKNAGGNAALWEATFASPSLHKYRVDAYGITTLLPNIHKGAAAGLPLPWGGETRAVMPIDASSFNIDSDAAYKAAAADPAAAEWLKKNPDKPLTSVELGNAYKLAAPVWYLVWGDKKDGYAVYVDATSGKVVKK
jgi:hypothetical protein